MTFVHWRPPQQRMSRNDNEDMRTHDIGGAAAIGRSGMVGGVPEVFRKAAYAQQGFQMLDVPGAPPLSAIRALLRSATVNGPARSDYFVYPAHLGTAGCERPMSKDDIAIAEAAPELFRWLNNVASLGCKVLRARGETVADIQFSVRWWPAGRDAGYYPESHESGPHEDFINSAIVMLAGDDGTIFFPHRASGKADESRPETMPRGVPLLYAGTEGQMAASALRHYPKPSTGGERCIAVIRFSPQPMHNYRRVSI